MVKEYVAQLYYWSKVLIRSHLILFDSTHQKFASCLMVYKLQVISLFICRLCSIIVCVIFALKRKISYLQKKTYTRLFFLWKTNYSNHCAFISFIFLEGIVPSFLFFLLKEVPFISEVTVLARIHAQLLVGFCSLYNIK